MGKERFGTFPIGARNFESGGCFLGRMAGKGIVLAVALFISVAWCRAQSISGYIAGGTAMDSSAGPLDTLGAGTIYQTPRMGGFFETIGGDLLIYHGLGVGAEVSYRRNQGSYAGLEYKPSFFDVNAVYRPLMLAGRISPEIQGGYGRADMSLYLTPQICATLRQGCGATNAEIASINDSEYHFAAGVRVYAYRGIFVRPMVDVRHAGSNFASYFGSPWISQYSIAIGYTFHWGNWRGIGK